MGFAGISLSTSPPILFTLVVCAAILPQSEPTTRKRHKLPRRTSIANCPDEGCGTDPNLNRLKNIRSMDGQATVSSGNSDPPNSGTHSNAAHTHMKKLDAPENFSDGDSGEELTALGEQ
jgi:hypothetical protein